MIKLVFFFNVTVPCVDKNDLDLFLGANYIDNCFGSVGNYSLLAYQMTWV